MTGRNDAPFLQRGWRSSLSGRVTVACGLRPRSAAGRERYENRQYHCSDVALQARAAPAGRPVREAQVLAECDMRPAVKQTAGAASSLLDVQRSAASAATLVSIVQYRSSVAALLSIWS